MGSKLEIQIGFDTSLAEAVEYGELESNDVYVVADNGHVSIRGPFENWQGYKTLADFDDAEDGEQLARKIAANPVAELTALGYDHAGWFEPVVAA